MRTIVVGVDDSSGSRRALAWAAGEARVHGARLVCVNVYEVPLDRSLDEKDLEAAREKGLDREPGWPWKRQQAAAEQRSRSLLENAFGEAAVDVDDLDHELRPVARDSPSQALADEAQDANADLLVVGSRGRGGFTGLLVGSVSQQCVQHARCPVTVVR